MYVCLSVCLSTAGFCHLAAYFEAIFVIFATAAYGNLAIQSLPQVNASSMTRRETLY